MGKGSPTLRGAAGDEGLTEEAYRRFASISGPPMWRRGLDAARQAGLEGGRRRGRQHS